MSSPSCSDCRVIRCHCTVNNSKGNVFPGSDLLTKIMYSMGNLSPVEQILSYTLTPITVDTANNQIKFSTLSSPERATADTLQSPQQMETLVLDSSTPAVQNNTYKVELLSGVLAKSLLSGLMWILRSSKRLACGLLVFNTKLLQK